MATVETDRAALEAMARQMASAFINAEQSLKNALALQVKAGFEEDPYNVTKALRLTELRKRAESLASGIERAVPGAVEDLMRQARSLGEAAAEGALLTENGARLPALNDKPVINKALGSAPAAIAANAELASAARAATRAIFRFPDDIYREAVRLETTQLLLGQATSATAQQQAWQRLVQQAAPRVVDKAGRKWNTATYVEMATRTSAHRAWDAQHELTMADTGLDFVSIAVGNGACKACSEWAGKILRRDAGPTGRIAVPDLSSEDPEATVTIRVDGTLDDARRHGWRHPNCRCRPVAYVPGVSQVEVGTTYDPEAEAAHAKQRELERKIRKAKEDEANAITPEERAKARARVRKHQAEMREHVKKHDLNRKSRREQIDLGNKIRTEPISPLPSKDLPTPQGARFTRPEEFDVGKVVLSKKGTIDDRLREIWRQQGYDGKPMLLDDDAFEAAVSASKEGRLYRGFQTDILNPEHTGQKMIDQLAKGDDPYVGAGFNGNGTYTARNKSHSFYFGDDVVDMTLHPDAKGIDIDDLQKLMTEERFKIADSGRPDSVSLSETMADPGRAASMLGYDYIRSNDFPLGADFPEVIVLNRRMLIMRSDTTRRVPRK